MPTSQDGTLAQILTAVQHLDSRVQSIDTRLENLERKVEERLYDARPIWEKVQADISRLQEGQEALRKDVQEMNTHWRDMNRKLTLLNDTLAQIQVDYRDIYDRVRGLEGQRS